MTRLAPLAAARHVELRLTYYADNAPISVQVSHVALSRLFLAVLDNAIEHTGDATTVAIDVLVHPQHVEARVVDSGPGIAAADIERIFERFARGPETGRRRGYGLGLFLARNIAERGGGSLSVERTSAAGSVFLLQLPRVTQPATSSDRNPFQPRQ
ncbi:sensor histidine kinase [Leucobacter insecticola]|uniref:sensor histidine kinase n=1 Tax=Leucobacter insecticola TaxID=2714934 RepID=UPI001FCB4442|nr:sensor histidine kinase [Leucobacter insecticola]